VSYIKQTKISEVKPPDGQNKKTTVGQTSRNNKLIGAYIPAEMYNTIRNVAVQDRKTIQEVICNAMNRMLIERDIEPFVIQRAKNGRPRKVS
jgi:hypothetical protein